MGGGGNSGREGGVGRFARPVREPRSGNPKTRQTMEMMGQRTSDSVMPIGNYDGKKGFQRCSVPRQRRQVMEAEDSMHQGNGVFFGRSRRRRFAWKAGKKIHEVPWQTRAARTLLSACTDHQPPIDDCGAVESDASGSFIHSSPAESSTKKQMMAPFMCRHRWHFPPSIAFIDSTFNAIECSRSV